MLLSENPFAVEGKWYKGNLHTHTNNSDGAWPKEKVAAEYKANGYNFLFITDHRRVVDVSGLSEDGFLVLHGEEIDCGKSDIGHSYHLAALNLKETVSVTDAPDIQGIIDLVREKGGEVVLAHPYWSGLTIGDMMAIEGCVGVEVFNTTCANSIAKGYSAVHWDDMLARGKMLWGIASDDTHQHLNEYRPIDICDAWIMAKLPELTETAVMDAIKAGRFYASNGPSIKDISIKDGKISVSTSEVKMINFVANVSSGSSRVAMESDTITEAEYQIRGSEKYVRVECFDKDGRWAWSNPLIGKD